MESEVADGQRGPRREPPAWDELWPPRQDAGPEGHDRSASRVPPVPPGSTPPDTGEPRRIEGRVDLKLAALARVMETRHSELAARVTADLHAMKASMEAALNASEERLSASIRAGLRAVEARSAQLEHDAEALRTDLLAAVAEQVEARSEALHDRQVAGESAFETRIRSGLDAIVESDLTARRAGEDARRALTERVDGVDTQVAALAGELAGIGAQVAALQAGEVRDDVDRLSKAMDAHRAETATRADLVALEDRVGKELAGAQSEVNSRLTTLDAVVAAVDAAAASLDEGLVERLTGVASVAASTALAPVRSDLCAVHDEVAATQKSIQELRRRVQTLLPPAARIGAGLPTSKRADPRNAETHRKGTAG